MAWRDIESTMKKAAQTQPKAGSTSSALFSIARLSALAGLIVAAVAVPAATAATMTTREVTKDVMELPLTLEDVPNPQTTELFASNGDRLAYFYEENRQDIPLDEIAPVMQDAIISIEDYRFYEHGALDLQGTLRALVNNAGGGGTQGGSTLTQQLVKLTTLQQATTAEQRAAAVETTAARKVRELKLAINFEEKYTKDEILERYLNIAYFGSGAYGVNAAAQRYFSVSPAELTAGQAALIAGLVQNPVQFDPRVYPERALQRRNTVLAVMAQRGKISADEATQLSEEPLGLNETEFANGCYGSVAAFSCDYIQRLLLEEPALGDTRDERLRQLQRGGLTIKSNIDIGMQNAANAAASDHVDPTDQAIGALAMIEPGTGKVRALAQSRPMGDNAEAGQSYLNYTVPKQWGDANGFQAGSTFKMFTVAAALRKGIPVTKSYNSPQNMTMPAGSYFTCEGNGVGPWPLANSTGAGTFNMYTGTRQSVNTYFSQLERDAGLCETVSMAEAMGIQVPDQDKVGPFTLGATDVSPLDLAAAYAVPASGGMYCKPQPIDEILDRQGNVVKKYEPECDRVLTDEEAAQINDILRGVQEPGGFGYQTAGLSIPSAAKTGTTNDTMSVTYAGYTPELATAAMIAGANQQGQPHDLRGVVIKGRVPGGIASGSGLAGPMWGQAMRAIQGQLAPVDFAPPPRRQPANRPPPRPAEEAPQPDDGGDDD
ncbi:penicillin-binding protein [Aeromicrobium sp. YIM 150415]|uniref:transglycosylase domain-containing protein n=1 Tax=Aeromicrobium sp. YIM 150415 TaxID=2803912 RepID=UPI00196592B9|nr:transglycosylase domain-containing protein [Aeromicrobium sp. YIM 150415]MBM9464162.1 penicillin-binding protein [Aeromicrobium sp. YIM 150415]